MQRGGGRHHHQRAPQNNRQASRTNPSGAPTFESLSEEAFQLSERAERKRDEQASNLLSQCAALYQQALALNPHHLDTRYNLSLCDCLFRAHAQYSRAMIVKSNDLERNLLLESISNFKAVAEVDPSRHAALYNAALAYLLLGDRLQLSQQKLEAYHASAHSFSTLFQLLPQLSPTIPPSAEEKLIPLPETKEERIERQVMEALLMNDTVNRTEVLTHWGEALAKQADIEPNIAVAEPIYARARQVFEELLKALPMDADAVAACVSTLVAEAQRYADLGNEQANARALGLLQSGASILSRFVEPFPLPVLISRGDLSHALAPLLTSSVPVLQEAVQYYTLAIAKLRSSTLASNSELGELHAKRADVLLDAYKAIGDPTVLGDAIRSYEEALRLLSSPSSQSDDRAAIVYNYACCLALAGRSDLCSQQLGWLAATNSTELVDARTDPDFNNVRNEAWFKQLLVL